MANDNRGYVLLNRNITDNWIFQKPLYFHWFMYILLKANFKDNDKFMYNGEFMTVKRGEYITSYRKLASELPSCSEQKIRTFLKLLEKAKTIEVKSTHGATHISILNYDSYQSNQHTDQQYSNTGATQEQHRSNNNRNNDKQRESKKNNDYKTTLLSELKNSDVENQEYLEITLAFKNLFKSNLNELGILNTTIDKAKGKWIDSIRLMIEVDKRSQEEIREVFDFLKLDEFWRKNILSTSKLREKFEQLLIKSRANKNEKSTRNKAKGATWDEIGSILNEEFGHLPN